MYMKHIWISYDCLSSETNCRIVAWQRENLGRRIYSAAVTKTTIAGKTKLLNPSAKSADPRN